MDWFLLTIILSFVATTLVLSMRAITPETNPFLFMSIVTGLAGVALLVYCYVSNISLKLNQQELTLALSAGLSVTFLDLAFIFMFRKGATVSVSMQIFRVASILLSSCVGFSLFQEQLSATKISGIVIACISVYLLNSKQKGDVK